MEIPVKFYDNHNQEMYDKGVEFFNSHDMFKVKYGINEDCKFDDMPPARKLYTNEISKRLNYHSNEEVQCFIRGFNEARTKYFQEKYKVDEFKKELTELLEKYNIHLDSHGCGMCNAEMYVKDGSFYDAFYVNYP